MSRLPVNKSREMPQVVNRFRRTNKASQSTQTDKIDFEKLSSELHEEGKTVAIEVRSGKKLTSFANRGLFSERPNGSNECSLENLNLVNNDNNCGVEPQSYIDKETEKKTSFICKNISEKAKTTCSSSEYKKRCFEQSRQSASAQAKETIQSFSNTVDAKPISLLQSWSANRGKSSFVCKKRKSHDTDSVNSSKRICQISETTQPEISSRVNDTIASAKSQMPSQSPCFLSPDSKINNSILGCFDTPSDLNNRPCPPNDQASLTSNDQHLIGSQPIREERSDVLHSCRNEDRNSLASNDQYLIGSQPIREERSDVLHSCRNEDRNSLASNDQHLIGSQPIREERSDVLHSCRNEDRNSLASNDQYLIGSQPIREERSDVLHSYRNEDRISLASNDQHLIGSQPIREERSDVLHSYRNEDRISLASNDQHLIGSQPIREERSDVLHSYRNEDRNSLASNDQHLIGSQPIREERSDVLHSCRNEDRNSLASNDQYLIGSQPIREERSDVLHSCRNEDRNSLASNDQHLIGSQPIREERSDVLHSYRNEDRNSLASNDQHLIGSQPIREERSDVLHSYRNEDRISLASNDRHLIGSQPIREERSDVLHSYRNEDRNSLASNDQHLIGSQPIREERSDVLHSCRNEDRNSLASNDQHLIGSQPIREERSDDLHSCRNEDRNSLASNDQYLIGSQPIREERSDVLHSYRNEVRISLASNDQHLIGSQPIREERSDVLHSYRNEGRISLTSNDQHSIGSQPIREERSDVLHNYRNGDRVSIVNRQRCPSVATASVPIPSKNTDKCENYSSLIGATATPVTNYDLINLSDRDGIKLTTSIECSTEAMAPRKLPMTMRNDSQIERSSVVEALSFDSAARASVENAQLKLFSNSTSCADNQKAGRSNHHFDRSVHMKYNQVSYEQTKIRDIRVKKSFSGKQLYAQKSETIVYTEKQNYFDDERKVESTVEAWDPQSIGKSFILEQKSPNQNQAFEFFNVQSPFQTPKIQNLNGISLSATPKTFSGFSFASGVLSSSQPKCNSMNHVFSETPAHSEIHAEEQTPDVLKTSTLNGSKTPKKVSFLLRNEKQNSNTSSDVYYQFSSYEKKLLYILNFHFFFIMAQNSDHLRILVQSQHSRKLTVLDPELGLVLKQIRATVEDPDDLLKLSHMLFAAAQTASQVGFFLLPMMLKPPKRFQTPVFLSYHHNIVNQIKSVTGAQNFTTIRALVSCVESEFFQSKNSRLIICIGNKLPSFIEILESILENNLLPKIPNVKLRSMHRENFSAHRLQAVLKEKHLVLVTSQQSRFRSVRRSKTF